MDDGSARYIRRLNTVPVTPDDLFRLVEEAARQRKSIGSFDGMLLAIQMFEGDKVQAVYFRLQALALVLERQQVPGYALRGTDEDELLARRELIAAAATEPLIAAGNDLIFEPTSFLRTTLAHTAPEGSA
jgi:hypothetical protein